MSVKNGCSQVVDFAVWVGRRIMDYIELFVVLKVSCFQIQEIVGRGVDIGVSLYSWVLVRLKLG